jgi:hypothetical protein
MVSFWPDSIWTPEFTDLATVSPSPHRHLDGMAVAAAAAVLTKTTPIVTTVVDTVIRAVLDAGYPGVFDIELVGPRIDAEGPHSATARAAQRISDILTTLGA